jgi:hypothetical protein
MRWFLTVTPSGVAASPRNAPALMQECIESLSSYVPTLLARFRVASSPRCCPPTNSLLGIVYPPAIDSWPHVREGENQRERRFILERHGPLEKCEYARFVIGRKDEDSHVEQGIFQAAAQELEWQTITGCDVDELNELREWFSEIWKSQLPSDATSFPWVSDGSRLAPQSTSPASGRWSTSSNATAFM